MICTRRRPAILARCLAAVARLNPAPTEVIVVDNTQGDSDTKKVAYEFGARYTVEPRAGLSPARKRGLSESKTKDVAFLEDDALPAPDWLKTFTEASTRNKNKPTGSVIDINLRDRRKR